MSLLKKLLPRKLKKSLLNAYNSYEKAQPALFAKNRFLASFFYFALSTKFDRETKAVLAGRRAYLKNLKEMKTSHTMLRRNSHRLEKGLIMQPRRPVFAEAYILETVQAYKRAAISGFSSMEEAKWFTDVLYEYFSVVKDTPVIAKARALFFEALEYEASDGRKSVPYPFKDVPECDISFDSLHQLYTRRRSVRWFQDKDVPMELIEKAIGIATLAPSACNRQPYAFHVSSTREKAVQMAKCAGGSGGFAENLPCVIAIVGDLSAYPKERDRHVIYIDGSLASMQLMLALETLGLSTCSINWPDVESAERKMQKLLGLPDYERPIMLLAVGYAREDGGIPFSHKKSADILLKTV
jgi:nitroreductase